MEVKLGPLFFVIAAVICAFVVGSLSRHTWEGGRMEAAIAGGLSVSIGLLGIAAAIVQKSK